MTISRPARLWTERLPPEQLALVERLVAAGEPASTYEENSSLLLAHEAAGTPLDLFYAAAGVQALDNYEA